MGSNDFVDDFNGLKISKDQDINILLLGETGVGKSTFVNSIANYLHYKHFKKASKEELLILIPSVITVTDKNFESVTIQVGSKDNNEYQEVGAAGTQDVKTYVFPIGAGKTRLRFIDSPGMGDPRGIDQDDINCENILTYLAQLKELHAICFLMKPTNTRITVLFEYCVKQILSRLEKSASQNIIFIFTNTRGTNYTSGDTLPCLRKVIQEIKAKPPHVEIPLKNSNIFNLDNEAFRYLIATKHNIEYDETVKQRFIESWNNSSKECWRLIAYIIGDASNDPLKPHQLQNTLSVNDARRLIVQLSQPLADISQLIYDNIRILDRHRNNLKMENQSLDELKRKMFIPTVELQAIELTQPVTVCTSTKCVEMVKVGEFTKPHYRQRCHDPCFLKNVVKEIVGDPNLVHCAAMDGVRTCRECTCDYLVHQHIYYMTKTVESKIVDPVVQRNIDRKETAVREVQRLIEEIDLRKTELEEERDVIVKSTAQFAHFLQNNAISPFNDSYKDYIKYLISREQSLGRQGDHGVIDHLQQLLRQYDEVKAAFDNSLNLTKQYGLNAVMSSQVTAQTVIQTIHKLYQLKHNGKKIKELIKKQKASRNSEYDKSCEYIHPSTTGLYTSESKKDKSKKENKKDGKKTDDEKNNKDKKKQNKDDGQYGKKHYTKVYNNRGNTPCNHVQHIQQANTATAFARDPPPPYPGNDFRRSTSSKRENEFGNVVVKVELSQPNKKKEGNFKYRRQDSSHRGQYSGSAGPQGHHPFQDYYRGQPPPLDPYQGPSSNQYQGSPQGYYGPRSYQAPPQNTYPGQNYGPPSGPYHGGQPQGPPPAHYYLPPQNYYHGPPLNQYQGPPHGHIGSYSAPSEGPYNQQNSGHRYNKRGGGKTRGRSKSYGRKDKKSGTERSHSSDSDSSE